MDISFKCPTCDQELEVDASAAGSTIECPSCSTVITVPVAEPVLVGAVATAFQPGPAQPPREEKHFAVPMHEHAAEALIQKPNRPLDIIAKEGDKTIRIKTFKRSDCVEVGKDHFDEIVSGFLEKVGQTNIVNIAPITYTIQDLATRQLMNDYGVVIVYKG
jgi:DNA-directed RNA polymerase subunit RPC12/RpoP